MLIRYYSKCDLNDRHKKSPTNLSSVGLIRSAERQGFEPRGPRSTTVFKTAAIDHSATSPKLHLRNALFF